MQSKLSFTIENLKILSTPGSGRTFLEALENFFIQGCIFRPTKKVMSLHSFAFFATTESVSRAN